MGVIPSLRLTPCYPTSTRVYCIHHHPSFDRTGTIAHPGQKPMALKLSFLRTLRGHVSYVWSVAFSPDGQNLASGDSILDHTAKLWNVQTGQELRTLPGHSDEVESVAFSPDGKTLASRDETIMIW